DVISVGGKIIDMSGQLIDFVGGVMTFDGHAFQNGFRYPFGSRTEPQAGDALFFACGGNMISRREPFLSIGGFDDDYFAYLEDVDFGWRQWIFGRRIVAEPRARARHRGGATGEALGIYSRGYLFEKNAFATAYKNFDREYFTALMPSVL